MDHKDRTVLGNMKQIIAARIPYHWRRPWQVVGWVLIIATVGVSLMPISVSLTEISWEDKIGHVVTYGVLMAWFAQLKSSERWPTLALSFCAMGALLEVAQYMTGYRYFELRDMLANASGVLLAWLWMVSYARISSNITGSGIR